MGKRKNRSKAMCLAAKRCGGAAKPGADDAAAADTSIIKKQKTSFGDDNEDEDATPTTMTNAPPPPPQQQPIKAPSWWAVQAQTVTHFEDYYRRQNILPDQEWGAFLQHLRKPLPVTFRLSKMASHRHGRVDDADHSGCHPLVPLSIHPAGAVTPGGVRGCQIGYMVT
jgi:tRNA (cytosine34-C5)-methyltransferase